MSVVINTNSAATMAANNLALSNQRLQTSLNRLSSGSKIVSPADDAGGLAVSMKLAAAANRQGAVGTNLANAASFLQTQDGAMTVLGKVLDRISELKTLYQDSTKNSSDLANYDAEYSQLRSQITSLSTEKFNGVALFSSTALNVGTNDGGASTVAIGGTNLLGGSGAPAWSNFSGIAPGANWTSSDPINIAYDGFAYTRFHADGTLTSTQSNITGPYTMNFTFQGTYAGAGTMAVSGGGSGSLDLKGIPGAMTFTDHTMAITVDSSGNATWSMDSGTQTGSVANFASASGGAVQFAVSNTSGGNDLHVKNDFAISSTGGGGSGNLSSVSSGSSLASLNLSTITSAIQDLATDRAGNGAQQSRLGFASELLTVNKANLEAANSRITDVDVAAESTQLARFNVLTQAGSAMLMQANQSTQLALKLLQ